MPPHEKGRRFYCKKPLIYMGLRPAGRPKYIQNQKQYGERRGLEVFLKQQSCTKKKI